MSINERDIGTGELAKPGRGKGSADLRLGTTDIDIDAPMTDEQGEHLHTLCEEAGEPFDPWLTQAAADRRIRALQRRAGLKP